MVSISGDVVLIVTIVVLYLLVVLGIGQYAARQTGDSREDYFMASRSFGTIVLLGAIFATNMSAVTMIGAPGLAYNIGPNAFGYFVGLFIFVFPVLVITIGYRIWLTGKKFELITPAQVVNHRLESTYLGVLVMLLFSFWTVPYLLVGIQGSGIVFEAFTEGAIPYWAGGFIVTAVVFLYVSTGGMRGTGWTNTFQGAVFVFALLAFVVIIPQQIGGFQAATQAALEAKPAILNRADIPPLQFREYFSVAVLTSIETFILPHLFIRYMTGKSYEQLKQTAVIYPLAIIFSWGPAVLIGFWGAGQFASLENPDFVLPLLIQVNFPTWMVGLALAGILAALMSTLDGQVLTIGTMLTEDILRPFFDLDERTELVATRVFILVLLALAYVSALFTRESIIDTTIFAFSGYALMFFPIVSVFYAERMNKFASGVSLLIGFFGLWGYQLGIIPAQFAFGFLPVIPLLIIQILSIVVLMFVGPKPSEDRIEQYQELFKGVW